MAKVTGFGGKVKIGSNFVADVKDYSFTRGNNYQEQRHLGEVFSHQNFDGANWTGTITCSWNKSDSGQSALNAGSDGKFPAITVEFQPEGTKTGGKKLTASAVINSQSNEVSNGAFITNTFEITGTTPLVEANQS